MAENVTCPICNQPAYRHNGAGSVPRIACAQCGVAFENVQASDWRAADAVLAWFREFRGGLPLYWGRGYDYVFAPHIEVFCLDSSAPNGAAAGNGLGYHVTEYDADRKPQQVFEIHFQGASQ